MSGINFDRFVNALIERGVANVSRRGFGIFGMVAYHNAWLARSRTFSSASELRTAMIAGGYTAAKVAEHPLYLGAVAFCSITNRPPTFKVLRRAGKPTQRFRLTPATPSASEVFSITIRGVTFSVTADATPTVAEIVAAFVALMTADVDAIVATGGVTAATAQALVAASFNGVIGAAVFGVPRNVTFTLSSHADWDVGTIVVTGLDDVGRVQSETLVTPNGGNATLTGTKLWSKITNVAISAMSGAGGTYTMGVGILFDVAGSLAFTATNGTTYLDIVNATAGDWYGYQNITSNLGIEDRSADDGSTTLTDDLDAIQTADPNVYVFEVLDGESSAMIHLSAAWAESNIVFHVPQDIDTLVETSDLSGVHAELKALEYTRTFPAHIRKSHRSRFVCALVARVLGEPVGSTSYIYKQLPGQTPDDFSADVVNRICGTKEDPKSGTRGVIYVAPHADGVLVGEPFTVGGFTSGGIWAHQIAGVDAWRADLQAAHIERQLASNNLPFTERSAVSVEEDCRGVTLKYARAPHNLLDEESIAISHTPVADIDDATRALGDYDGIAVIADTQGTMASITVRGTAN